MVRPDKPGLKMEARPGHAPFSLDIPTRLLKIFIIMPCRICFPSRHCIQGETRCDLYSRQGGADHFFLTQIVIGTVIHPRPDLKTPSKGRSEGTIVAAKAVTV